MSDVSSGENESDYHESNENNDKQNESVIVLSDEDEQIVNNNDSFVARRTRTKLAMASYIELGNVFVSVKEPQSYKKALESVDKDE